MELTKDVEAMLEELDQGIYGCLPFLADYFEEQGKDTSYLRYVIENNRRPYILKGYTDFSWIILTENNSGDQSPDLAGIPYSACLIPKYILNHAKQKADCNWSDGVAFKKRSDAFLALVREGG